LLRSQDSKVKGFFLDRVDTNTRRYRVCQSTALVDSPQQDDCKQWRYPEHFGRCA
jgi:hypothetical protein